MCFAPCPCICFVHHELFAAVFASFCNEGKQTTLPCRQPLQTRCTLPLGCRFFLFFNNSTFFNHTRGDTNNASAVQVTPADTLLVRDLTLSVPHGTNLLVTGPNGAGKSSLFRVLGGLWHLQEGVIRKPGSAEDGLSHHIFYVPQRPYVMAGTLSFLLQGVALFPPLIVSCFSSSETCTGDSISDSITDTISSWAESLCANPKTAARSSITLVTLETGLISECQVKQTFDPSG